jgi:hypothetical protein
MEGTTLDSHCTTVVKALARGHVVPLLGAGANLCDRPEAEAWGAGRYLPSGSELAAHLADDFGYPGSQDRDDLIRMSEYVDLSVGAGPLYQSLHDIFAEDYPPTSLHRFLAALPAALSRPGKPRHLLVVTTNYDDLLERAFDDAREPYDLVIYQATGASRGLFRHILPDGEERLIDRPNEYGELSLTERSAILKIHGAIDRAAEARDSYVITGDDYIEYLSRASVTRLIPVRLLTKLLRSNFLFLGYRLRDWNLRVILHQIWEERNLGYTSWAIQRDPDPLDRGLWKRREVEVLDVPLRDYVKELERRLDLHAEEPVRG